MKNPFRDYNGRLFAGDFFGGAIAALIALPYGLAMASLMGLPPILGLYTSLFAAPICALLGRNPVLIGGTSSATVPFILGAVRAGGISGAAKICIFAAVFLLIFCIMRLGRYVAKVPHSVLAGFSCGIGGLMVISQLKVIFALKAPPGGWSESMFGQLMQSLEQFRAVSLASRADRRHRHADFDAGANALFASARSVPGRGHRGGGGGDLRLEGERGRKHSAQHAARHWIHLDTGGCVQSASVGSRPGFCRVRRAADDVARGGSFPRPPQAGQESGCRYGVGRLWHR